MPKTWFIGDPHFGHKRIIELANRPFINVQHNDNVIINLYNDTVGEGDLVFWLGDMFFCNTARMEYITDRLNMKHTRNIVIRGNHDKGISDTKFKRFGFMPYKMYSYRGLMLTHRPMVPSTVYNMLDVDKEMIGNLHAHTHDSDTGLNPNVWQCASVEKISYKPIEYEDVLERFRNVDSVIEWYKKSDGKNTYFDKKEGEEN